MGVLQTTRLKTFQQAIENTQLKNKESLVRQQNDRAASRYFCQFIYLLLEADRLPAAGG
jgi:hypothetical protein